MSTPTATPRRLYLMQVATVPQVNIPIVCYLVQTSDGLNILIDSGLPENVQPPPGMPTPILYKNVLEQLSLLDLRPEQIDFLICTHFDTDHCRLPKRLAVSYQKVGHKYYIHKETLIAPHKMRYIQKSGLLFLLSRELKSNFSNLCGLEGREISGEWQYEG